MGGGAAYDGRAAERAGFGYFPGRIMIDRSLGGEGEGQRSAGGV